MAHCVASWLGCQCFLAIARGRRVGVFGDRPSSPQPPIPASVAPGDDRCRVAPSCPSVDGQSRPCALGGVPIMLPALPFAAASQFLRSLVTARDWWSLRRRSRPRDSVLFHAGFNRGGKSATRRDEKLPCTFILQREQCSSVRKEPMLVRTKGSSSKASHAYVTVSSPLREL